MLSLLASLLSLLAAEGVPASAGALGTWTANGARLELKDEQGKVVGRLAGEGGPCAVPVGTELLRGTFLDDSLSAEVELCLVAPQCRSEQGSALAVLLVTKTLSGGVHTRAACAQGARSLVLRRPGAQVVMAAPAPNERLSRSVAPPRTPRAEKKVATNDISIQQTLLGAPAGETPNRPAGTEQPAGSYDPRDARKAGPPTAAKLLEQGAAQLQAGRFERARKLFKLALEKDPQGAEAYNGVGVTYYARGDLDEALAWYKRSLEANPRFGDSFYNMACVYALQHHKELAFRYLRLAALNHYSERDQMQKDADLASLRGDPQWAELLDQLSAEAKPSQP